MALERNASLNKVCCDLLARGLSAGAEVLDPEVMEVVEELQRWLFPSLTAIVLFGSRARGDEWCDSDYDLLVILDRSRPISRDLYRELDQRIDSKLVSPHFAHLPQGKEDISNLFLEIALDGRVLLDTTGATTRFLRDLKDRIASGAYRRAMIHGQPVWETV